MKPANNPLLELRIRHTRPPHDGVKGFSLDIELTAGPGITVFFGHSGSGKSTTLAAVAGLLVPDSGFVRIGGETWFDSEAGKIKPIHLRRVAFVFQSLALFPHMTAVENAEYGISRDVPADERKKRAAEMLARMRVAHLSARRPASFSGGEAQRVALARAFAMDPRLVLLDEPFSAMDRDLRLQLTADVRRMVDESGIPLIHVTHHRHEARALADRVFLFEAGKIVSSGHPDDIIPADDDSERELLELIRNRQKGSS